MKTLIPVTFAAFVVAGCASPRQLPTYGVSDGAYLRNAATIERNLEKQNQRDYDCQVQDDTLIVCNGVRHQVQ
jgi:hypothetical protein